MNELPILSILILLPLVGIFFMTLIRNDNDQSSNNKLSTDYSKLIKKIEKVLQK